MFEKKPVCKIAKRGGARFFPGPKKERVVTLWLDDSTISELKAEAARKSLGTSTLLRKWVGERLDAYHQILSFLKNRLGIIDLFQV
jgi:hypothetical protein